MRASRCGGAGFGDRRRRSRDRVPGIVAAGTLAPHRGGTLVLVVLVPGKLTVPDAGGVRADVLGRAAERKGPQLPGGGLWERESEVTALGAAFDAAASGTGQLVLVEGPAGIGKSRLLAVARSLAVERQLPVLAARGLELEREVPFGVARQLFVPPLMRASGPERASLLAGPAALAQPLLDGSHADARIGEGQAGALVEGLHWLAANLAQAHADGSSPARLAVIVDDAQWADRPSLRFIAHMAGQFEDAGFCVVAAVRAGEPGEAGDLLGRLRAQPGCVRLRPAVLTEAAVSGLIRAHHFPDATDEFCWSCAHVSGGNPFTHGAARRRGGAR